MIAIAKQRARCNDGSYHLRCFNYSTLSRLMWATNPESGTVTYSYDNNGNLLTQRDANGSVITAAGYDGMNRPATVTYTPGNTGVSGFSVAGTPTVTYTYDSCASGAFKGALCAVSTPASSTAYGYDGFGRIATSTQTTGSTPYTFRYGYSLTDQLTSMTYPSGRQVNYGLDAADRVTTVQNVTGGGNYAANIGYTADGSLTGMTLGQGLTQTFTWNDRLQPLSVTTNSATGSQLLGLSFFPCAGFTTSCFANNGNLQGQTITMPGLSVAQSYSYDHLNRLTSANESGGTTGWAQSYNYDGFGNRWVTTNQNLPYQTLETPAAQSWYSTTIPNRLAAWTYDYAGNVLQVGGMARSFQYDAQNQQTSATLNGATANYIYDGDGLRVQKSFNGVTTTYVYDAWGNLAAEYSSAAAAESPCGVQTCYVAMDHLGSTRMITDGAGSTTPPSMIARYDYQPFGQEIGANYDGRTTAQGYAVSPDSVTEKFTGQARDPETGIDWYRARYMSGAQGRFQSPDPGSAGANPGDPQTWNMYSYVRNNPLVFIDPTGLCSRDANGNYVDSDDGGTFQFSGPCVQGNTVTETAPPVETQNVDTEDFLNLTFYADSFSNAFQVDAPQNLPPGTPQKYSDALKQGLDNARAALKRRRCADFYGGGGPQTLDATKYRFLDLGNPTTGAATISPTDVFVNTNGAYMTYSPAIGQAGPFGRFWTQGQFRGFILLHELGHQLSDVTDFQRDAGEALKPLNEAQSRRVLGACF